MNLRYSLGAVVSLPLLPVLYYQGKKVRASVPVLPEATGPDGYYTATETTGKELKLITIGESTIAGVGVGTHEEGFSGTLAAHLGELLDVNVRWNVYARSGYTARRVVEKIIPKIDQSEADVVVVGLGGNDAFTLNTPGRWRKDMSALIAGLRLKFPEALIVFCNMPPIREFPAFTPLMQFMIGGLVEILGEELQEVVQGHERVVYASEVITLDGWIEKFGMTEERSEFFSDGVHPSKLTYQTWAQDIAGVISEFY